MTRTLGMRKNMGKPPLPIDLKGNGPLSWKKTSETYNKPYSILPLASSWDPIHEFVPQLALHDAKLPSNLIQDEESCCSCTIN